jgi:hypothetical protein
VPKRSHTDFWNQQAQEARQAAQRVENPEASDLLAKADEYDRFAACNKEWETRLTQPHTATPGQPD